MNNLKDSDDEVAIKAIVARQFASLCWTPTKEGNWSRFADDFLPGAVLYPSARPAKSQTVDDFLERMKSQVRAAIPTFHERALGVEVSVFGNVAVATAGCAITENDKQPSYGVEMLLLIKDAGTWKIVAQAWDNETPDKPMPDRWRKD